MRDVTYEQPLQSNLKKGLRCITIPKLFLELNMSVGNGFSSSRATTCQSGVVSCRNLMENKKTACQMIKLWDLPNNSVMSQTSCIWFFSIAIFKVNLNHTMFSRALCYCNNKSVCIQAPRKIMSSFLAKCIHIRSNEMLHTAALRYTTKEILDQVLSTQIYLFLVVIFLRLPF